MSEDVSQSPSPEGESGSPRRKRPEHYVGADPNMQLPPKGVPVYVDHPFLKRDQLFDLALCAFVFARHVAVKTGVDKSQTDEALSWLKGEIPIPENILEMIIIKRAEQAKKEGLEVQPARAPDLAESA